MTLDNSRITTLAALRGWPTKAEVTHVLIQLELQSCQEQLADVECELRKLETESE